MQMLILGGGRHVGRNLVEAALARGHQVTTLNRGQGWSHPQATQLILDRTEPGSLAQVLATIPAQHWDAVLDTWSAAPRVVHESAETLALRTPYYGYVSSRSVYSWPIPIDADETAPVVDGDPHSTDDADYAQAKRGAELAIAEFFPANSLCARAGLILGPYENVGRLPWWLGRLARGGRVLAPGPKGRPLQYIDGRDLADWMVRCAETATAGTFNAVSRPGHTTMGELLDIGNQVAGDHAELVWVEPDVIADHDIAPWTELPIWLPPTGDMAALHAGDVTAAFAAGLTCRPVADTVAATWAWLQTEGWPVPPTHRATLGLDPAIEAQVLAQH